jgi:hypothetical protein
VRLASGTKGNFVAGIKRVCGFPGIDNSTQIKDEGSNNIVGLKKPVPV